MGKKIATLYLKIVEFICVLMLCIVLLCMVIQIGCRLFTIGQSFTEELARICFNIMIYAGAPLALAEGADICVDMIVNMLPALAQRIINIFVNILVAIFGVMCVRSLITFTASNVGVTAVSMTWFKMNWVYYTMMVSFVCLSIVAVVKAIDCILNKPETLDINEKEKQQMAEEEEELDLGI